LEKYYALTIADNFLEDKGDAKGFLEITYFRMFAYYYFGLLIFFAKVLWLLRIVVLGFSLVVNYWYANFIIIAFVFFKKGY